MYEVTLQGTPAQMGRTHGALLRNLPPLPTDPRWKAIAVASEAYCREYVPEFIVETEALAAAAGQERDGFVAFTLCASLGQTIPSCSVVAVLPERSATGKVLVGRNYDFDFGISWEGATTYHTRPENGYAHVGNCDIWVGREDGLNEVGLFVGMSATFVPGAQPGLPFWFVVRAALERCATVDEARAWIESVPHTQSRNYMLADGETAVVIEATIDGCFVREAENGVLAMTNHPLHPALVARQPASGDSARRYARLRALDQGKVTAASLQATLNDRASGLCAWEKWEKSTYGTIWSVVAEPGAGRFALAHGTEENHGTMIYHDLSLSMPAQSTEQMVLA